MSISYANKLGVFSTLSFCVDPGNKRSLSTNFDNLGSANLENIVKDNESGSFNNVITFSESFSGCFEFGGGTAFIDFGYVDGSHSLDVGTNDFSLDAWIYLTGSDYATVISAGGNLVKGWYWGIRDTDDRLIIGLNASSNKYVVAEDPITRNAWNHISTVVDRNSGVSHYINGILQDSHEDTDITTETANLSLPNTEDFHRTIGIYQNSNLGTLENPLVGKISHVKLYNGTILTQEEVTQNYESTKYRFK